MEALFADWRTVLQVPLITNEYLPLSGNGGINRNLGNSPQRRSKQGRPRCRGVDTKRRFIFAGAAMCESACHFQRHRFSRAPLQIGDGSATDAQLPAGWEISCLTLRAIPAPLDKCKGEFVCCGAPERVRSLQICKCLLLGGHIHPPTEARSPRKHSNKRRWVRRCFRLCDHGRSS